VRVQRAPRGVLRDLCARASIRAGPPTPSGTLCVCRVSCVCVCCQIHRALTWPHNQSYELGDEDRVVIGGDLNTFGHGLLRLSPFHCNDAYRFRSLFYEEAQVTTYRP